MIRCFMFVVVPLLIGFAGCNPVAPAATNTLPKERATECENHCRALDMKLGAVIVMANQAGCVCVPTESAGDPSVTAVAAAGGLIVIQRANAAQRSSAQQRQNTYKPPPTY